MDHVGQQCHVLVMYGSYMGHIWVMWVMNGLYGSTIGHVWVIHRSYGSNMDQINGSCMGQSWVMYGLFGSTMGQHVG